MTSLLHLLPPEAAHRLALFAVKNGLAPRGADVDAPLQLLGKVFRNPVGLAAGADKRAEALAGWARMGFGFVEVGTVTRHARRGNPRPRLWRIENNAFINWLGLPGEGLEPFVNNLRAFQRQPERNALIVGASLATPEGNRDDLRHMAAACAPYVDYLTLNMSCPNIAAHETPDVGQIRAVTAGAAGRPVLVKIGPSRDAVAVAHTAKAAMAAGAAGIIATNTVPFDHRSLLAHPPAWPQAVGGYSGPQLLDISCAMIQTLRQTLGQDVPLIGCGGVQGYDDAQRMFRAGAHAIQLYTGLVYHGAPLIREVQRAARDRF